MTSPIVAAPTQRSEMKLKSTPVHTSRTIPRRSAVFLPLKNEVSKGLWY